MMVITASDHMDPEGVIVRSGELLADRVVAALRSADEPVLIRLRGLGGISSSYFNILLRRVGDALGQAGIDRVTLEFVSPLQRQVYDRSLDAFRAELSTH